MSSQTQTITPLMMNADVDVRKLKENEMIFASCVRVSEVEESDMLVLKNSIGNRIVDADYVLPAGENQVLGSLKSDVSNSIYYFIWNSNKDHRILVHDISLQKTSAVVKSNKLPFIKGTYILGTVLNLGGSQDILYWTDRVSRPCSLNVQRFRNFEYGAIQEGDFYMNKRAPLNAPEITMGYDSSIPVNNVFSKSAQFAYRYEYADGEFSVFSPYSKIAVSRAALSVYSGATDYTTTPNYVDVEIIPGGDLVRRVEVVVRFGIDQPWFVLANIPNPGTATQIRFDGAGNYIVADPFFASLLNDGVPLAVNDIGIFENRNVVVGYREGYNQVDVDFQVKPRYNTGSFFLTSLAYTVSGGMTLDVFTSVGKFWVEFAATDINRYRVVSIDQVVNETSIKLYYEVSSSAVTITDYLTEIVGYGNAVYAGTDIVFSWTGTAIAIELIGETLDNIQSGRSTVFSKEQLTSSFLDGDVYDVSIVYYDDYLGNSPVSSSASKQVEFKDLFRRAWELDGALKASYPDYGLGSCHLDVLVKGTPPLYAKSYRVLVKNNSNISDFRDYGVTRGFYDPVSNRVWLHIEHQLQLDDSFSGNTAEAPDDEFIPQRGDVLEVRSQLFFSNALSQVVSSETLNTTNGSTPRARVAAYRYAEPNAATNPFYVPGDKYTFGNMIAIEPTGQYAFDAKAIVDGNSAWNRFDPTGGTNFSTVVRVKRLSGETPTDTFYELSEALPIVNPGSPTRTHGGVNNNQGTGVLYPVTSINAALNLVTFTNYQDNISVGDRFTFSGPSVPAGTFTVKGISKTNTVSIITEETIPPGAYTVESITTTGEWATTSIKEGNVWTRTKPIARKEAPTGSFTSHFIVMSESRSHSSYFFSQNFSKGRVHGASEYSKQFFRRSTMMLSEPINQSGFNGLATFNLPLTPFKDLSISSGEIQRVEEINDNVVLYYDEQVGVVKLNKSILFSADGGSALALSNDLISDESNISSENGTRKPTSVVDGMFYDVDKGDICKLGEGVKRVSDEMVASILAAEASLTQDVIGNEVIRVYAGAEPKSGNKIFAREAYSTWLLEDSGTGTQSMVINATEDVNNIYIPVVLRKRDSSERQNAVDVFRTGILYVPEIDITSLTSYVAPLLINPSFDFDIVPPPTEFNGTYSFSTGLLALPKSAGLSVEKHADIPSFAIVYSDRAGWSSTMPYCPDGGFAYINNNFYSFSGGRMYLHDLKANRNEFYGVSYRSYVEICFNVAPNATKHFKSIKIDGSHPWAISARTNISKTQFPKNFFEKLESFFYTDLPFDVNGGATAHIAPIGEIAVITGSDIRVSGFRQDITPLVAGDKITNGDGPLAVVVSVSGDLITLNSTSLLSTGMFIFVEKNGLVDGDAIRGYYMILEMTSNEHVDVELNGVTAYFSESKNNLLTQ